MELLEQFAALTAAAQLAIMGVIAGGVVAGLRACGLKLAPDIVTVLASVFVGAAVGFLSGGWEGAVLGALAGLVATGGHQLGKKTREALNGND